MMNESETDCLKVKDWVDCVDDVGVFVSFNRLSSANIFSIK